MFVFVPVNPPAPSPEAEDLGLQIADLVRDYRELNPEVSPRDVVEAFTVARATLRPDVGPVAANRAVVIGMFLALFGLAGLAAFYFVQQGGNVALPAVLPVVIGVMIVAIAFAALAGRR